MREVQRSEAEARWPELLADVERGETVVITRRGRPIARVVPEASRGGDADVGQAVRAIREHQKRHYLFL